MGEPTIFEISERCEAKVLPEQGKKINFFSLSRGHICFTTFTGLFWDFFRPRAILLLLFFVLFFFFLNKKGEPVNIRELTMRKFVKNLFRAAGW
jgi:hypothetical protein